MVIDQDLEKQLEAGGLQRNTNPTYSLHTCMENKLGSTVLWLLAFPGEGRNPEFPVHCIGTRKLSNVRCMSCAAVSATKQSGHFLIIVLAKIFIYKCKTQKNIPQFDLFKRYLKRAFEAEKHIAIVNMAYKKFVNDWYFLQRFHGNLNYI